MTDHSQIATETQSSAAGPDERQYDMRPLTYAGTVQNPRKAGTIRAQDCPSGAPTCSSARFLRPSRSSDGSRSYALMCSASCSRVRANRAAPSATTGR